MERTADSEAMALDDLGGLAKVLEVLSAAVSNVDLEDNLERALAQDILWVISQHPEGVFLSDLIVTAARFFGHSTRIAMTGKERGQLLKVLTRLRKAGLIAKSEKTRRYRPTATSWLKVQGADHEPHDDAETGA